MAEKPHMNLAMIGHVDHGKSTLLGRLFMETGAIDKHEVERYKKEAEEKGKATFEYAWVLDTVEDERKRGLTIDIAHRRFDTGKYYYTIVDCPGHSDFVKNMITGASQADVALLVVEAPQGVMPQTKEHLYLAFTLGISQIIVVINKMDMVDYKQERYEEVKKGVSEEMKKLGYDPKKTLFVPASAYEGENITESSDKMPWYDGPPVLEAFDTVEVKEKPIDLPLRLPVQDVFSITGVGTVPVGRVETGVLKSGDKIIFEPSGKKAEVRSMEMHHESIPKALPGDNIGWNVRGIARQDITRGEVCGHVDNPPTVAEEFTARVIVLTHPTAIVAGYTPVFHCHTAQTACRITEITQKLDPKTGEVTEEHPDFIKSGDAAVIKAKPTRPMVIEKYKEIPQLGRFAIRDMGQTIAAGMVIDVKPR